MIAFVEERGFFSNRRGRRLYYAFHGSPAVTTLWVFCNPFLEEKTFAHPVYVHFARHLAGLGNAVLRFDYEGDGDSEGETVDASLGHWRDDVEDALAFATARAKPSEVVLFGLRLGAAAAVLAAERAAVSRLVLWDPVTNGQAYLQECLKFNLTTQLSTYKKVIEPRETLVNKWSTGASVNILGHEVGPAMAEALTAWNLEAELKRVLIPVDVVAFIKPGRHAVPAELECLKENARVRIRTAEVVPFWQEPRLYDPTQEKLVRATPVSFAGA